MTNKRTIVIEHEGETYTGHIATIENTSLGWESHGIFTAYLNLKWDSAGISVGGYCLDEPRRDEDGRFIGRFGTAYGLDHVIRIIQTVGVTSWEKLPGTQVIALFEGPPERSTLGRIAAGIAGVTTDRVLILKQHAEDFRAMQAVAQ